MESELSTVTTATWPVPSPTEKAMEEAEPSSPIPSTNNRDPPAMSTSGLRHATHGPYQDHPPGGSVASFTNGQPLPG